MSSGPATALVDEVRAAAQSAAAGGGVRFDNGHERPLGGKGRRTRARILRGAGDALLDVGWVATTMSTVAERAGVGTGTIYQYFRRKEDVLAALVGEWTLAALGQLRRWQPADGKDGLRLLVGRFVAGYVATAPLQRVWEEVSLTDPHLARLRQDLTAVYVDLFAEAFREGVEQSLLELSGDATEVARAMCAMVDRYCYQAFVQADPPTVAQADAVDLLTDLWAAAIHLR